MIIENMEEHVLGTQCSIIVETGATLDVRDSDPLRVTSSDLPYLEVSGTLSVETLILAQSGSLVVHSGGHLNVMNLILAESASASFHPGAQVGRTPEDTFSLINLDVGPTASLLFQTENVTIKSNILRLKPGSRVHTSALQKTIHFVVQELFIQDEAILDVSGGGLLEGPGKGGSADQGASHGGQGGNNTGAVYGSLTQPTDFGSGTGQVRGGGIIQLEADTRLVLDGKLLAAGESGVLDSGGGSGGSIWISTPILTGHGSIHCDGGVGGTLGGGGGGRVAIIANSMTGFHGYMTSYGGLGMSSGAAGSIYKQYTEFSMQRYDAILDNRGETTESRTILINPVSQLRLALWQEAKLELSSDDNTFEFQQVMGDSSGVIYVQSGQAVSLATSYGITQPYKLPCKVAVDSGGQVALPQKVLFTDTSQESDDLPNLQLAGGLTNTRELVVGSGSKVILMSSSYTVSGSIANPPGHTTMTRLDITRFGSLEVALESVDQYNLQVLHTLKLHYGASFLSRNMAITAPTLDMAVDAVLQANFQGYPADAGPGAGLPVSGEGSGASHGGSGSTSLSDTNHNPGSVGSVYLANQFGSGGGTSLDGPGGCGGGRITIDCTGRLILNGRIESQGESGSSAAGGGAGGAIQIQTMDLIGTGTLDVRGGDGGASGGGAGGGGRIALTVTGLYNYTGNILVSGGNGADSIAGGSGTAYITRMERNIPYQILYLSNKGTNTNTSEVTIFREGDDQEFAFDELQIIDGATLWLEGSGVTFVAKSLHSDQTARIHIPDDVVMTVDTNLPETSIHCSLDVSESGEIRLPKKVTFLGPDNQLAGIS